MLLKCSSSFWSYVQTFNHVREIPKLEKAQQQFPSLLNPNFSPWLVTVQFQKLQLNCFGPHCPACNWIWQTLPLVSTRKLLMKLLEHKLEEASLDGTRGDVYMGHFIIISVPVSQQIPRLPPFYLFSSLN